jgi:hypothetical protein
MKSSAANRKRDSKAATKSSAAQSDISRSSLGRFEGRTQFGEHFFTKEGSVGEKQKWKCQACQKKTVNPLNHSC